MRSADRLRRPATLALAMAAVIGVSGCVSTQTKNARTLLVNARTIDSESSVHVTRVNSGVAVLGTQLISSRGGAAVVVTLRNGLTHPVSDLPISVGLRPAHGAAVYLNRRANLAYWDTHVAAINAAATTVWVLSLRHAPAQHGTAFAEVGFAAAPPSTTARSIPQLTAAGAIGATGRLGVSVNNPSGIPQYDLPVYAVAERDGKAVAAATGTITELDGGSHASTELRVVGSSSGATFQLSAPATIFH